MIRNNLGIADNLVIGHVGRFAPQKNHKFIIEVFTEALKTAPNAVLLLIGEDSGEISNEIHSLVSKRGILDKIKQLEETETDYQVTENKEALARQQMELRQQNALRKLEKATNPTTLVQQNIQQNYNMTSSELLNQTLESMHGEANVITNEKDLPHFDLD